MLPNPPCISYLLGCSDDLFNTGDSGGGFSVPTSASSSSAGVVIPPYEGTNSSGMSVAPYQGNNSSGVSVPPYQGSSSSRFSVPSYQASSSAGVSIPPRSSSQSSSASGGSSSASSAIRSSSSSSSGTSGDRLVLVDGRLVRVSTVSSQSSQSSRSSLFSSSSSAGNIPLPRSSSSSFSIAPRSSSAFSVAPRSSTSSVPSSSSNSSSLPLSTTLARFVVSAKNNTSNALAQFTVTHGPALQGFTFDPSSSSPECRNTDGSVECSGDLAGLGGSKSWTISYRVPTGFDCSMSPLLSSVRPSVNDPGIQTSVNCSVAQVSSSQNQSSGVSIGTGTVGSSGSTGNGQGSGGYGIGQGSPRPQTQVFVGDLASGFGRDDTYVQGSILPQTGADGSLFSPMTDLRFLMPHASDSPLAPTALVTLLVLSIFSTGLMCALQKVSNTLPTLRS